MESPRSVVDIWIGEQLRSRRMELRKSLKEVAEACEISISLLSQIERGLRSVSMINLRRLSACLGRPLDEFVRQAQPIDGPDGNSLIARSGHHISLTFSDKGILKENITPPAARQESGVEMYRAVIQPGGSTGATMFATAENHTVGYVVQGRLELTLNDQTYSLCEGDSFYHKGSTLRRWSNSGNIPTIVFWAIGHRSPKVISN